MPPGATSLRPPMMRAAFSVRSAIAAPYMGADGGKNTTGNTGYPLSGSDPFNAAATLAHTMTVATIESVWRRRLLMAGACRVRASAYKRVIIGRTQFTLHMGVTLARKLTDKPFACGVPREFTSRPHRDRAEMTHCGRTMPGLHIADRRLPRAHAVEEIA